MKSGVLIFNVVLLILIGVLFYLHFSSRPKNISGVKTSTATKNATSDPTDFKIAYFEMDSLENSFTMVKDVKNELSKREEAINYELSKMEKSYRDKATYYQKQAPTMNQQQSEIATRDMMQMQQSMQSKKQSLDQDYQDLYMRKMKDIKTKIEDFLKEYNKSKGFSYIFAYEPGLFYYRDSAYNITPDVIKGLNDRYSKKKP